MTIHSAYWYTAHFDAGLLLAGQNEDGDLEWMGTQKQFQRRDEILEERIELL